MDSIEFFDYTNESMLADIHKLVSRDLSEPYSIFTYRYFLHNWPKLCICARKKNLETNEIGDMMATIVCKVENVEDNVCQGYIAMLAVEESCRKRGIGSTLVNMGIERMIEYGCSEIVLETEVSILFL
jgi:peptide alpha-N-acetyltransferase